MIVDDNWNNRQLLIKLLAPLGFELQEANNGQEAIELCSGYIRPYELVGNLYRKENQNDTAMTYFKKEWPSVPLIVLTGFPDVEMATSLLHQGAFGYLVKPVEGEKLKTFVAKAIGQRTMNWM